MTDEIRLRVGIALGAGSASALAEIGVLQVLATAGIPIHCVAGTSAGAVVGAAFAAGKASELHDQLAGLTRSRVMRLFDLAWSFEGFLQGRRALEFIRPFLGDRIEGFDRPYAAVATDLRTGDEVTLTRGPVFDAVRASIAVPGVFTPWRVENRLLVDGGLVNPVPVSTARALGAEFVIAVNVLPLREARRPPRSIGDYLRLVQPREPVRNGANAEVLDEKLGIVEIVSRASRILESQVASIRLREDRPGWLFQLPVPDVGMFDVHRAAELAAIGRRSAEAALPQLRAALARAVPLRRRLRDWQRWASERLSSS